MTTLAWILIATVAGGVLSVLAAGVLALTARGAWIPILISYAVGTLLGAAFLELMPQASSCWRSWCCGATAMSSSAKHTIPRSRPTMTTVAAA
jgi:zinc transporter ZupT